MRGEMGIGRDWEIGKKLEEGCVDFLNNFNHNTFK